DGKHHFPIARPTGKPARGDSSFSPCFIPHGVQIMKRMLLSGGLLAGDIFAQTSDVLSGVGSFEIHSGLQVLASIGLLLSLLHFAKTTAEAIADQPETFTL